MACEKMVFNYSRTSVARDKNLSIAYNDNMTVIAIGVERRSKEVSKGKAESTQAIIPPLS